MSLKEKSEVESNQSPVSDDIAAVDKAWKFLDDHRDAHVTKDSAEISSIRHKIDWHIVPLMFCCYTMQFLDKVILNVRRPAPTPTERLALSYRD